MQFNALSSLVTIAFSVGALAHGSTSSQFASTFIPAPSPATGSTVAVNGSGIAYPTPTTNAGSVPIATAWPGSGSFLCFPVEAGFATNFAPPNATVQYPVPGVPIAGNYTVLPTTVTTFPPFATPSASATTVIPITTPSATITVSTTTRHA